KELKSMGKTIIISSHILPELAEMCDVIVIVEAGEMIATGNVDEIYARMQGQRLLKIRLLDRWEEAAAFLQQYPKISHVTRDGQSLVAGFTGSDEEQVAMLLQLAATGLPLASFGEAEGNLEEIFLEITKGAGS
ncbi:DUF4162 domain-containing protein, partial [Microbacteriaceae bacterium K1510]|nr:DUF4162 domain-containing protein [Microbacteriaceae bacterium K1510]